MLTNIYTYGQTLYPKKKSIRLKKEKEEIAKHPPNLKLSTEKKYRLSH